MEQEKQENVSLNVYHERAGDTCRVTAGGDIDLATVARLREAVAEAAVAAAGATTPGDAVTPPRLVLDLRAVEFMDSAGLALLVELRDRYGAEKPVELVVRARSQPERVLRLGRFDEFFQVDFQAADAAG